MSRVFFAMLVHSHQPVGNFDHVLEEAYQKSYRPFLRVLEAHPQIRVSLHYSGILLEWMEAHHPEFFAELRKLIERRQAEMIGGGYYEPILPAIPDADKVAQVRKLSEYLRDRLGVTPRGAWIAERVWEPTLARPLAESGIEYVSLDDTHFLAAGLEPPGLRGAYISEEEGFPLRLVPALKSFRYTIPFREPQETLRILQEGRDAPRDPSQPPPLFVFGDDCEKFGIWPGTFEHCYKNFWLERFLHAIEGAREWLTSTTLGDFVRANPPLGRVYLPAASYPEMMEWALAEGASREFKACLDETDHMAQGARFKRFLLGGIWRNFLSKYPESNQIHKLMLQVSRRWHEASRNAPAAEASLLREAQAHLLAGQCNDAYWHGAFGGLYAPHLRSGVLRNLVQAEALLDRIEGVGPAVRVSSQDFDLDGHDEILMEHASFGMVARPADGATVSSLRFKAADVELINSLMRRPEVYHDLVRSRATAGEGAAGEPASIHDRVASKESNLAAFLRYDRYARHSFRTYLFPGSKRWEDFARLRLDEHKSLAQGAWAVAALDPAGTVEFHHDTLIRVDGRDVGLRAVKWIAARALGNRWEIECRSSFSAGGSIPPSLAWGVELVFNLLAPDAPDRYYLAPSGSGEMRYPLGYEGEIPGVSRLMMVDEWQQVRITMDAQVPADWWITPIHTISQSESGFERVYQGSAILVTWKPGADAWQDFTRTIVVRVERFDKTG